MTDDQVLKQTDPTNISSAPAVVEEKETVSEKAKEETKPEETVTAPSETTVTSDEADSVDTSIVDERGAGKKVSGHIVINKSDNPLAKWFVAHTTSGHEVRVAQTLKQRIETMHLDDKVYELLVPTQDRIVIRGGKKSTVKEKIFPGYLLIKMIMDDTAWLGVRTTPGITGFVGTGKSPTPLSEAEVANIQKFVSSPAKRFKTKFSKTEAVKITDGPFSDFLGTIEEIDEEKGKVKVLVSIFGRETPVELDILQIAKV